MLGWDSVLNLEAHSMMVIESNYVGLRVSNNFGPDGVREKVCKCTV